MKKIVLFFVFVFSVIFYSYSQISSQPDTPQSSNNAQKPQGNNKFFNKDNLVVGGGLGLGFGNFFTSFSISPEVGYHIYPDRIVLGTRFYYNYYRDKTIRINGSFPSLNILGGGPFVRGYIWKGLMAQVEYEYTYIKKYPYSISATTGQVFYKDLSLSGFLVGGGYHQNHDSGAGFYIVVLFNVVQNTEWLYPNPVFRTGFTYTFKKY